MYGLEAVIDYSINHHRKLITTHIQCFYSIRSIILWSWCEYKGFHRIHLVVAERHWISLSSALDISMSFSIFTGSVSQLAYTLEGLYLFVWVFCHFMCLPKTESDKFSLKSTRCLRSLSFQLILFHFLLLIVSNGKMYYFDLFHARPSSSFIHQLFFFLVPDFFFNSYSCFTEMR